MCSSDLSPRRNHYSPVYSAGKLELGLCKGKKLYDKRASAAARDAKRDIDRALKTQR